MTTSLDQRGTLDWPLRTFASLFTEMRGGAPLKPSDFTKGGVKVVPKGGIGRTGWLEVEERDLQYCSEEFASAHRTNLVTDEYTLVVLRDLVPSGPSIGLIVQKSDPDYWILAQGVYGFKLNGDADPGFLSQVSNTQWYRRIMNQIMVGSTQVHITNTAFKSISIPVPEIKEQRAIATALSDVDALIARLEKLIAKKRDLKQAAMQQLLTGQTRLPGFSGEWVVKHLGDLAEMGSGGTPPSANTAYYGGDIPWVAIGDMTGVGKYISATERTLTSLGLSNSAAQIFPAGTVLYAMYASLGECSMATVPVTTSQAILGIRPKADLHSEFLYYLLTSWKPMVKGLGQQGTQANLNKGIVADFKISMPALEEQESIAAVLIEMDNELAAFEARLAKTRELKQGMMQELLTGRTRLV
jgi:type I restriction enzyme S subunit